MSQSSLYALRSCLPERKGLDSSECHIPGGPLLQQALKELRPSPIQRVAIAFSKCKAFTEEVATAVADSLPASLTDLDFIYYDDPNSLCADAFVKGLAGRLFGPENQAPKALKYLALKTNGFKDSAYDLSVALNQGLMPELKSIDFGCPALMSTESASQLTFCAYNGAAPKGLSFFGSRCASHIVLRRQRLTSTDLILILASAVSGACGQLMTLDVSENHICNKGLEVLERNLELVNGERRLPDLQVIDLSKNDETTHVMRQKVLEARRGPKIEPPSNAPTPSPLGGMRVRYDLNGAYQFRIEPFYL